MTAETIDKTDLPTAFGAFKPTGHLMLGFPTRETLRRARQALVAASWSDSELVQFGSSEAAEGMQALIDGASSFAGFGSEISMMRRYAALSRKGWCWLLVPAPDETSAHRAADIARMHGAELGVHYGALVVESIIDAEAP